MIEIDKLVNNDEDCKTVIEKLVLMIQKTDIKLFKVGNGKSSNIENSFCQNKKSTDLLKTINLNILFYIVNK